MFCQKCGSQNDDSAVFCQKCGHRFGTPVNTNGSKSNGYILKSYETAFIIIVGVISLVNGGLSLLTMLGLKTMTAQSIAFIGGISEIIFGVGALLKQRWAFIILAILYAYQTVIQILGIFMKGDLFQAAKQNNMIVNILIAAYYAALLVFIYISQDALSSSEQSSRQYEESRKNKKLYK